MVNRSVIINFLTMYDKPRSFINTLNIKEAKQYSLKLLNL